MPGPSLNDMLKLYYSLSLSFAFWFLKNGRHYTAIVHIAYSVAKIHVLLLKGNKKISSMSAHREREMKLFHFDSGQPGKVIQYNYTN